MQTTCQLCNRKAVFNLKHVNGKADITGPVIQLGAEERYFPSCFDCYRNSLLEAGQVIPNWEEITVPSVAFQKGESTGAVMESETGFTLDDSLISSGSETDNDISR